MYRKFLKKAYFYFQISVDLQFLFAAVLVGSKECPYANPQVRSMTCIKDLPSIRFRPVDIQKYQNTDSTEISRQVNQRHEKRGSIDKTEVIMTPAVEFPPPSTPEMTLDFLNYFCRYCFYLTNLFI